MGTIQEALRELRGQRTLSENKKTVRTTKKVVNESVDDSNKNITEGTLYDKVLALAGKKSVKKEDLEQDTEVETTDDVTDNPELLDAPAEDNATLETPEENTEAEDARTDEEIFLDYLVNNFDEKQVEKACKALDIEIPEEKDDKEDDDDSDKDNTDEDDADKDDAELENDDKEDKEIEEELGDVDADGDPIDTKFNFEKAFSQSK